MNSPTPRNGCGFWTRWKKNSAAYNIAAVYYLQGVLDKTRLENSFNRAIARHESLRTVFVMVGGEPKQKIVESLPFHFEEIDCRGMAFLPKGGRGAGDLTAKLKVI